MTLKLKTATFEIKSRSITLNKYLHDSEEIHQQARKLLAAELPADIRLMGLRMSAFKEGSIPGQSHISDYFKSTNSTNTHSTNDIYKDNKLDSTTSSTNDHTTTSPKKNTNSISNSSNNNNNNNNTNNSIDKKIVNNTSPPGSKSKKVKRIDEMFKQTQTTTMECPICKSILSPKNLQVNEHIDQCLLKQQSSSNKT